MNLSKVKKVLGLMGSPRRNGNTEILVDTVLAGAEEHGAATEKVLLGTLEIAPCRACDSCRKTGKCIHEDDMVGLIEQMKEADVWVLGTPVYWWGPTAQFKAFLDRWYGIYNQGIFKGKDIVLVVPLESNNETVYNPTLDMFKGIMDYLGMNHIGTVLATRVYEKGAVNDHPEYLDMAREIGRKAVTKKS
jgi:multimeric flavodoxin WrbA